MVNTMVLSGVSTLVLVLICGIDLNDASESLLKPENEVQQSHVAVNWDFEEDGKYHGWAQATWEEIGAQMDVRGGELRGRVRKGRNRAPRFDSPMFELDIDDDYVVGMRIKQNSGSSKQSLVQVRAMYPPNAHIDYQSLDVEFGNGVGTIVSVPFEGIIPSDGNFHIIYAPIYAFMKGKIVQLRIFPISQGDLSPEQVQTWSSFDIDWIKLIKKPTIEKVEGCINKYFEEAKPPLPYSVDIEKREEDSQFEFRGGSSNGFNELVTSVQSVNQDKHIYHVTTFQESNYEKAFSTTFNCPREGLGWRIRISGRNFGNYDGFGTDENIVWNTILIDEQPCSDLRVIIPQSIVECTLPEMKRDSQIDRVDVKIMQPDYRGLYDVKPYLSYVVAPPVISAPNVSNIASHSVDLSWEVPENVWDAVTVTGYEIEIYHAPLDRYYHQIPENVPFDPFLKLQDASVFVGNVTTTTVVGLRANNKYKFAIRALAEDQRNPQWTNLDLYGRREMIPGAVRSILSSNQTEVTWTLGHDINFSIFDANSTVNHGAIDERSTYGPTRNQDGEGHFGMILVGDAQIENCNTSTSCCDYDEDHECVLYCTNIRNVDAEYVNLESDRQTSTNFHDVRDSDALIFIGSPPPGTTVEGLDQCGPALRLTPSAARSSGASWYPRKMNVREGFETFFTFRISNPSLVCKVMDDVNTHCRSRGADGFAFVVQNSNQLALGLEGRDLGYGGIENGVAIEFDTFFNPETDDPYENHVGLLTRGWRNALNSSHEYEIGGISSPIDLTDGDINVRIVYKPLLDQNELFSDSFRVSSHATYFTSGRNADSDKGRPELVFDDAGEPLESEFQPRDWNDGLGQLSVFINDMGRPIFTTVLNLDSTINLDSGRAWVGFTAATGQSFWQNHDILHWEFDSLRENN